MKINISEVKANLSKFVNMAYHGEKIVILKNNIPCDIIVHTNINIKNENEIKKKLFQYKKFGGLDSKNCITTNHRSL